MGKRAPDETRPGMPRAPTFAVAIEDIEDADLRDEAARLAAGSDVHDLDTLDHLLVAADSVDALVLAYLLDREPHEAMTLATVIELARVESADSQAKTTTPTAELVLYVVSDSESCSRAQRTVERALRRYERDAVRVRIRNVTVDPLRPDEDRVIVAPTLVLRHPRRVILAGEVDEDDLDALLASAGLCPRRS